MRLVHMTLGVNCPEWMHKYLNGDWSGDHSEFANEDHHTPAPGSWLHSKRDVANHLFFKAKVTLKVHFVEFWVLKRRRFVCNI